MSFATAVPDYGRRLEASLERWLPPSSQHPAHLHEAMRYAVLDSGKRLRALLVYATGEVMALEPSALDGPATAVEMVHAYSLVHDDLPAMDDDDLRRGKPSCHVAFDEATAILAGDSLLTLAFHVLARDDTMTAGPAQRLAMIDQLAEAGGSHGMTGGQAMDLAAVGKTLNIAELESMHIHKTGALIRACILMGCNAGGLPPAAELRQLDHFAKCVGLAFQVHDDVLDELGDAEQMGKNQGADRARAKPTYSSMVGLQAARERTQELIDEGMAALEPLGERAEGLRWLARQVIERRA